MQFDEEIAKAVKHLASTDKTKTKTESEMKAVEDYVRATVLSSSYDFSKSESIILNQSDKKRVVKQYSNIYSAERILCQCIKQILDRTFKIKYPNRNKLVRSLFDTMKAVIQMADFTIIKFDFKDYFNSVSTPYVFNKYLKQRLNNRFEMDLIRNFVEETKFAHAGFSTSNVIAEIIAQQFDVALRLTLSRKKILFFERYIDDSIIIINEHIEENECHLLLNDILARIFHDNIDSLVPKCKTEFNNSKFVYISHRDLTRTPKVIDFLGYEFTLSKGAKNKVQIKYGITQAKLKKYNKRIDALIRRYKEPVSPKNLYDTEYHNLELLRHRIAAFTSRTVYQNRKYKSTVWKTKGFIGNYGELRYLLETPLIDATTRNFLENMVDEAFIRASLNIPYFLKGATGKMGYSLFENMKKNKTLLLVEHIGYSKSALVKLCSQVEIYPVDKSGKNKGYAKLVREYLVKLKVGY